MGIIDFKVGDIIKSVGDVFDNLTTSDEERLEKENEVKKMQLTHGEKAEEEITKRWVSDSNSDSRIAKLTRPMLVIYLMIITTVLAFMDGNVLEFSIKTVWVDLFTNLAITAIGGYFVLRTYEKKTGTSKWNDK
jgi:hypothetical protein